MTILFSLEKQAFYDDSLQYVELPSDLIEVTDEQHDALITSINSGCVILSDLTATAPKPSTYHIFENGMWVDARSDEQKLYDKRLSYKDLTQRQFRLVLNQENLLGKVQLAINAIADETQRNAIQIAFDYTNLFSRLSNNIAYMVVLLNLTDEQVDAMWEVAMEL